MHVTKHKLELVTTAGGAETEYTEPVSARVLSVQFIPATSNGIAATGTVTVTTEVTGQSIWAITATGTVRAAPRQRVRTATGLVAAWDYYHVGNERIKCVVAGGGSVKSGTVYIQTG